jgi:hypothetical protein
MINTTTRPPAPEVRPDWEALGELAFYMKSLASSTVGGLSRDLFEWSVKLEKRAAELRPADADTGEADR